jgi:superfamily II DNA or RNA helicase
VSKVILRDYQHEAVKATRGAWDAGMQRPAVVMPTGSGKTVPIAELTRLALDEGSAGRVLILAHRDELLQQAKDEIHSVAPDLRVGIVKGTSDQVGAPVVVGSVQTMRHEARRGRVRGVGLVIVDECHHATAASYRTVLEHYGCFAEGGARAVGFTATMSRGDGVGLGQVWQDVVYERDIRYMITRRFLVKPRGIYVRVEDLDLSRVRKSGGDYSEGQLGDALAASMAPERIVDAYREHAAGRPTLCFVPTVEFAELMVERFGSAGVAARVVHGAQGVEERRRALADFKVGRVSVLVNCMVLTEGTNLPMASCVIIARPTTHVGLYVQMVGRVLRTHPGKVDAVVLDVVGASRRHMLAGLTDLMGERDSADERPEDLELGEATDLDLLDEPEEGGSYRDRAWLDGFLMSEEVDLFHGQRARWQRTYGGHWFAPMGKDRYITVIPSLSGSEAWDVISVDRKRAGESDWIAQDIADLGYAMAHGESIVLRLPTNYAKRDATWRKRPASEAQRQLVRRCGAVLPEGALSGEASDVLDIVYASARIDGRVPAARL